VTRGRVGRCQILKAKNRPLTRTLAVTTVRVSSFIRKNTKNTKEQGAKNKDKRLSCLNPLKGRL
ncbi:hypothetical protein, partial [Pedobacter jamesrossensis]